MSTPSLVRLKTLNAKLLALQWLVGDFSVPSMPTYVTFNAAAVCNLKCPHCPTHGTREARREHNGPLLRMQPALLRKIANETLPTATIFNLTLIGEPLATPGAASLLRDLTSFGAKVEMTTNGTLWSPEWIETVLPLAHVLQFSVDGASPIVFERLRFDARYPTVLANAWLLGRTRQLVADVYNPQLGLACVAMGSNVRELPLLVDLAKFLRFDAVRFIGIDVVFESQQREALAWHQARYNYYRERAKERASALGVEAHFFTPPFEGVAPDPGVTEREGLIVGALPDEDYYAQLPPFETFVNLPALEAQALEIAAKLRLVREAESAHAVCDESVERACVELQARLSDLVKAHAPRLRKFAANPQEQVPHCLYLRDRAFFGADGRMYPCCYGPAQLQIGWVLTQSVAEHWNGPVHRYLAEAILRNDPHEVCRGCVDRRTVDAQHLWDIVFVGPESPAMPAPLDAS